VTGVAVLDEAAVEELRARLRGPLVLPDDADYHECRHVWNAMIDRHPGMIARCVGAADVISSVDFAREHGLVISVRGGAHNVPGNAVCDGGIVIDSSLMKAIRVDPDNATVRAEAGVKWGEFDRETQAFGLATTGGTFSDTGIAGLTLGGGIGWLGGKHGLASDNLLSADLVTADGQLITASRDNHPDLFWALRGGGGNFGVVTSFEYQLHPVATVLAGLVIHPFANAKSVLEFYRDFSRSVPDELTTLLACLTDPEAGPVCAIIVCYNGSLDDAERAVRPVREFGPPVVDQIGPMPYCGVQTMADHLAPPGRHWYVKAPFLNEISEEFIEVFVNRFAAVSSPYTLMLLQQKGGAMARGAADQTAFGHRDATHVCVIFAGWEDAAEAERHIEWTRTTAEQLWPYSSGGQYVNDIGLEADEGADQIRAAFGSNYERLIAVKNTYDPTNLFRHNQNLKPAS
jgi:FAD/FMN-containing dehydrogenase